MRHRSDEPDLHVELELGNFLLHSLATGTITNKDECSIWRQCCQRQRIQELENRFRLPRFSIIPRPCETADTQDDRRFLRQPETPSCLFPREHPIPSLYRGGKDAESLLRDAKGQEAVGTLRPRRRDLVRSG